MLSGTTWNGAQQMLKLLALAFFGFQLKDVAHVDEADDVVDGFLIDGNARKLFVNDELAQVFERLRYGDRDDVGRGRS